MAKTTLPEKLPTELTLAQAAELMKVEPEQVRMWTERGKLRALATQNGDEPTYEREEVLRLLSDLDAERPGPPNKFPIVGIGASAGGFGSGDRPARRAACGPGHGLRVHQPPEPGP
jgi:hypothetical protein